MMDFLATWVRDIFIVVVGLYFVEIVLPEGSMRKYIKFVFSILILGVVISPLLYLGSWEDWTAGDALATAGRVGIQENTIEQGAENLEEVQWIQMEQIYRSKIQSQVREIIQEQIPDLEIQKIAVHLAAHSDQKDFGKVEKIVINIVKNEYVSSIKQQVSLGLGIEKDKIFVEVLKGEDDYK